MDKTKQSNIVRPKLTTLTIPKLAISQSEAVSAVLMSCDIKSLT